MFRKAIVSVALSAVVVAVGAPAAEAFNCVNASRPAPAQPAVPVYDSGQGFVVYVVAGEWWYLSFDSSFADAVWDKVPPGGLPAVEASLFGLPAGASNGNYQAGQGFALLDNAMAPCLANRQTSKGIQQDQSAKCPS